jgi:hypothetical protein
MRFFGPGGLGLQFGNMLVLNDLRRQSVKRHGAKVADDT